jgi:hypothetical protein
MTERVFLFYRCPDGTVAFDAVISGGTLYALDGLGMCPLCRTPVAEHKRFTLRARRDDGPGRQAA